jgi:NADPH2:quinone reductase
MRAIRQRGLGGPEVLELVELPRPEPPTGHVLIEVTRAGVNFTDAQGRATGMRTMVDGGGAPQRLTPEDFPLVPGGEVAGVRADTGERVVALCGSGGYAEWAVAPEQHTYSVPAEISDEDALALLVQGTTAWHLYRTCARLSGGETVAIPAAVGGVGSIAVQLGEPMGAARVIGMASTDEKRELAMRLGAARAVDSTPEGLTDRLLQANDGAPVDVVFDMAGGAVFDSCFAALAPFGRMVVYGTASGTPPTIGARSLIPGSRSVTGFWLLDVLRTTGLAGALNDLFARVLRGELSPVIGSTYPLGDAARAQQDLLQRRTIGKLYLDPRS